MSTRVRVATRFQRSVQIDTDLGDPETMRGFICPASAVTVLNAMAAHMSGTGQGAFTWTGPYGAGKSSLAVALAHALGSPEAAALAALSLGPDTTHDLRTALPPGTRGWRALPVTGRRERPASVIGEAILRTRLARQEPDGGWSDEAVLDHLARVARRTPGERGGLIVFLDEMGKFLEAAVHDGTDIYLFQQLAELASRSNGRLIVVGILHQSFEEYALRLSREMRDEWSKIQGRFADLTIAASPDEMLDIIGRAIEQDSVPDQHCTLSANIAELTGRPDNASALTAAWPLHPVTASLIGPISRRRFGQNQRSVFGFLNSAEPRGFQDFVNTADESDLYTPGMLWEYLRFNLEQSILASPDGHRWALAVDAITRCESAGFADLHLDVLKTVALVDLFRARSGLVASPRVLDATTGPATRAALSDLEDASVVVYRKFNDSYGVFAGSDFDIEQSVEDAHASAGTLDYDRLTELAGFQPIVAKRHYHETGTLRWFRTAIVAPGALSDAVQHHAPSQGSAGAFLLALPMEGDAPAAVEALVVSALGGASTYEPAIGVPQRPAWGVATLARDFMALEYVRDHTPALQGDRVARIEVEGRITAVREQIGHELHRALGTAVWRTPGGPPSVLSPAQLNGLASDLADRRFFCTPVIRNELLNRIKPSNNAAAAQNALLRQMVLMEGEPRLDITGFPAEGGLFASLIEAARLYRFGEDGWRFVSPRDPDPCRLAPAWAAAERVLTESASGAVPVSAIWEVWGQPPLGINAGVMPVLTAAFMLSMRHQLAYYRDGVFQSRLTALDMEVLTRRPGDIQLRWMVLPQESRELLGSLAAVVREMDGSNALVHLQPIDVARGLIAIHDRLPEWTRRTSHLSANASAVRQMFKRASDPNRLIFDDIPHELAPAEGERSPALVAQRVRDGLMELSEASPVMLHRLRDGMLSALGVPNASAPTLKELRARAENVRGLGADHREEAFAVRIERFTGGHEDMAGLVSLAVSKPPAAWTDTDVEHAAVALAEMARQFVHREAFAHVKGRPDQRHSMAVVIGLNGQNAVFSREFDVMDSDHAAAAKLADLMEAAIPDTDPHSQDVVIAALAMLSARRIGAE